MKNIVFISLLLFLFTDLTFGQAVFYEYNGDNVDSTGTEADTLNDVSGNGYDAFFGGANNKAEVIENNLNGYDILRFDGDLDEDHYKMTTGANYSGPNYMGSWVAVLKMDDFGAQSLLGDFNYNNNTFWHTGPTDSTTTVKGSPAGLSTTIVSPKLSAATWYIMSLRLDGDSTYIRVNGVNMATVADEGWTTFYANMIGARQGTIQGFDGDLAAIKNWRGTSILTDAEILIEEGIFDEKYGLGLIDGLVSRKIFPLFPEWPIYPEN